jgi:hypothetical protein
MSIKEGCQIVAICGGCLGAAIGGIALAGVCIGVFIMTIKFFWGLV